MNRRELFQSVIAVAASSGVKVDASTHAGETKPALAVFECDHVLSDSTCEYLRACWQDVVSGTPFEGVKVAVLTQGLKLTLLDSHGRVLNRQIEAGPNPPPPAEDVGGIARKGI